MNIICHTARIKDHACIPTGFQLLPSNLELTYSPKVSFLKNYTYQEAPLVIDSYHYLVLLVSDFNFPYGSWSYCVVELEVEVEFRSKSLRF